MKRVLLVNGHGGNQDALRLAARAAPRATAAREVAALMWAVLAADLIAERAATPRHSHACDIETSVALAIAPQVVLADRIEPPPPPPEIRPLAETGSRYDIPVPFEHWTSNGALGDPRLATKELGEEIVALALEPRPRVRPPLHRKDLNHERARPAPADRAPDRHRMAPRRGRRAADGDQSRDRRDHRACRAGDERRRRCRSREAPKRR